MDEKRVLLINPHEYSDSIVSSSESIIPPLGLLYIAAVLEEKHNVRIIDLNTSNTNIISEVKKYDPDFIGITSLSPQFPEAIDIIGKIKDYNQDTKIILGGSHVNAIGNIILERFPLIDYIVKGDGEEPIEKLINGIHLGNIEGLSFRKKGKIVDNGIAIIKDLDALPFPARHLVDLNRYKESPFYYRLNPNTTLLSARGCAHHCIFCDYKTRGYPRMQSPERTIDEIKFLVDKGIKDLRIIDEFFTLNKNRIKVICDTLVKEKIDVIWCCQTRADAVDKELLIKMRQAGCYLVQYGIETGNEKIMKRINKNLDLNKVKKAVEVSKSVGLDVHTFFMLGFPFETENDIFDTIKFAKSLKSDICEFSIATPYPGTKMWENTNLDPNDMDVLKNLLFYSPKSSFFNEARIKRLFKYALKEFYLRPNILINILYKAFTRGCIERRKRLLKNLIFESPLLRN